MEAENQLSSGSFLQRNIHVDFLCDQWKRPLLESHGSAGVTHFGIGFTFVACKFRPRPIYNQCLRLRQVSEHYALFPAVSVLF